MSNYVTFNDIRNSRIGTQFIRTSPMHRGRIYTLEDVHVSGQMVKMSFEDTQQYKVTRREVVWQDSDVDKKMLLIHNQRRASTSQALGAPYGGQVVPPPIPNKLQFADLVVGMIIRCSANSWRWTVDKINKTPAGMTATLCTYDGGQSSQVVVDKFYFDQYDWFLHTKSPYNINANPCAEIALEPRPMKPLDAAMAQMQVKKPCKHNWRKENFGFFAHV